MKENLVKKVIQARTIEATKKGINPKLVLIAKTFGSPIIGHYYDAPMLADEDWTDFNDPKKDWSIEEADDGTVPRFGYVYDSLKTGVNLEIVVMAGDVRNPLTGKKEMSKPKEVRCSYRGYRVYHEEEGVIRCYAPFPEWEDHVNKMYKVATEKDKKVKVVEKEHENKARKEAAQKALGTLRRLWGI
jgi:hypothetical protein